MTSQEPKVLFLLGFPRSGTTFLANLLAEGDDVIHAGELHYLWARDLPLGAVCGCGSPVVSCPHWGRIFSTLASTGGGDGAVDVAGDLQTASAALGISEVLEAQRQSTKMKTIPLVMRRHRKMAVEYSEVRDRLIGAIAATASAGVVIDSSKQPGEAAVATLGRYETYYVLMVRDPRGAVTSRQLKLARSHRNGVVRANRPHLIRDAVMWAATNVAAEYVLRRVPADHGMRLRYEDFVSDPVGTLEELARFMRIEVPLADSVANRIAHLNPNHVVGGNRNKHRTGEVEITEDLRWKSMLTPVESLAIGALTFPVSGRYGYRFLERSDRR